MFRKTAFLIVALLPTLSLAGGYSSCYRSSSYCYPSRSYASRDYYSRDYESRDYAQTIVENQNVFYSVAPDVRQYAITPPAVAVAQYGQLQRQITRVADQLAEYREQSAYTVPQQQAVMCVPYCVPQGQVGQIVAGQASGYVQQPTAQNGYGYAQPGQPAPQPQPQQPGPTTFSERQRTTGIIDARCMKCHGSPGKARDAFDFSRELTCDQRLEAIRAVMAGEMPKNGKLTPDEIGKFIEELMPRRQTNQQPPPQPAPTPQPGANASM